MLGGTSGYAKYDLKKYADFMWSTVERIAGKQTDVIDVGCGDLRFWGNRDCDKYIGIDVSPIIINRDKKIRPNWSFILSSADADLHICAETVICINTLYHIMDDTAYDKIINNLMSWSRKWIVIITWDKLPKNYKQDDFYEKYRDFSVYKNKILKSGFKLMLEECVPFNDGCSLWIFERCIEC